MNVIPFRPADPVEVAELRQSERTKAIGVRHQALDDLAVSSGTPAEWLTAALMHLKTEMSGRTDGTVSVSVAALHLVLMRFEQLEHGGEPWRGGGT